MIAEHFNREPRMRRMHSSSILALLMAILPGVAGAQAFTVAGQVPLYSAPGSFGAIADVNRDGKPDLVTVRSGANTVVVGFGDGAGGFTDGLDAATVDNAGLGGIALGDVNGDGKIDLAVAHVPTGASVFLGNGAGLFGARADYATPPPCADVEIADMDGDGRPDLIVAFDKYVGIFPGNGAGGFGARQDLYVDNYTSEVRVGDLNGDGLPDVCVVGFQTPLSVFLSDGAHGYLPRLDYPLPPLGSQWITTGDVNGDGKLDVVITRFGGMSVFLGNGTGGLGPRSDTAVAGELRYPIIADMNGDGLADLAAKSSAPSEAVVMLGNGTGAFAAPSRTALPYSATDLVVGDLNGDGRPELFLPQGNSPSSSLILLNGTGGEFRARSDVAVGTTPRAVLMGEMNGDGLRDLVVTNAGSNTVSVLLGKAAGGFLRQDFAVQFAPAGAALGDVDGDGSEDIVVTYSQAGIVSVRRNGGFDHFGNTFNNFTTGAGPVAVALADLNDDGRLDMVVANNIANTLSVFLNDGTNNLYGPKTDYATGANPASVAIGDINRDGHLDLVVSNGSSNSVSEYFGAGDGTFGGRIDDATGTTPLGAALGDLFGNGGLGLAVANSGANTVSVMRSGNFDFLLPKEDYAVGSVPAAVAFGDINGDGRLDLTVANSGSASVSLLLGDGVIYFGAATNIAVASSPKSVAIGDLNGDGRLDLAVGASGAAAVSVLLGLVPTRTTLSVSSNLLVTGSPMILHANVSVPAPGIGTPADSVRFFDGTTLLGTSPVLNGQAGLVLTAQSRGERAITAVYKGDGKLFGSISNVVTPRVVGTAAAAITGITDVTGDQGGQARLSFTRSPYDYLGSATPITGYQVYRRAIIAGAFQAAAVADPNVVQLAGWDYLQTVQATTDDAYQVVVPTLADSNGTGIHRAVLLVRAATGTPGVFYDSPADSGYTVDNLAPAMPAPLTAAYVAGATRLHWLPNHENDLASYRVYKGASAGFVPGPGNLIASPPDTGYADAGAPGSFYKVSAVDVNGNQSTFALVGPDATTDVVPDGLAAFDLERVRPNPAPASRLVVSFSLPVSAPARLEMFDVRGRRVGVQDVGGQAGRNSVRLATMRFAPGVYVLKLTQGAASRTQRMTIVD